MNSILQMSRLYLDTDTIERLRKSYRFTLHPQDMVTLGHLQNWLMHNDSPRLNPTIEMLSEHAHEFLKKLDIQTKWIRLNGVDTEVAVGLVPKLPTDT